MEREYIGKAEAWEYCLEAGINRLPRKGEEIITIVAYSDPRYVEGEAPAIGKDDAGYYYTIINTEL